MQNSRVLMLAVLASLLIPSTSTAIEATDKIHINGFLSQGYLISSKNNLFTDTQNHGSFQCNEAGITTTIQPNDRLRLGLQFLSRDLGPSGNNDVVLDWASIDYRYHDLLGIRLGKVKMPMGLYNESRDSDFVRPTAFLPQSIYDEVRRDLLSAYQGAGMYGTIPLSAAGDLDYHLFYGQVNFPQSSLLVMALRQQAQAVATMKGMGEISSLRLENEGVYGGAIIYEPPVDGLRFGVSLLKGRTEVYFNGHSTSEGELLMRNRLIYSLEYSWERLLFATEYGISNRRQRLFGVDAIDGRTQEWYVMGSFGPTESLSINVVYDCYYLDQKDRKGTNFVKQGIPAYLAWQKDLGAGIAFHPGSQWVVKLEGHTVDGAGNYITVYSNGKTNGLSRYWNYGIIKASVNF